VLYSRGGSQVLTSCVNAFAWQTHAQVFYECLVVMYLMTQLPPIPTILNDDEKGQIENKMKSYGAALVPALEGLCLYKEQIATSKHVLTVCVAPLDIVHTCMCLSSRLCLGIYSNSTFHVFPGVLQLYAPASHEQLYRSS
jgi:hypothetical protein